MLPEFLTARQLAAKFGISPRSIWRWVKCGYLPQPVRFTAAVVRWDAEALARWLAEKGGGNAPAA